MTIGKREKIVIGSIIAIIVVALLHFLVFHPQQADIEQAKSAYEAKVAEASQMKRAPSTEQLVTFTSNTLMLSNQLRRGIQQLGMDTPDAFDPVDPADPNWLAVAVDKFGKQYGLIFEELEKLQKNVASQQTRMTFLGPQKWAYPVQLSRVVQGSRLWDYLNAISDASGLIKASPAGPVQDQAQANLDNLILQLGMDPKKIEELKVYGEFVPLIYQLAFVDMILKQIPQGQKIYIRGKELNQDLLMEMFSIPKLTLPIENLAEPKSYFIYFYLRYLNQLLDMAQTHQIQDVSDVTLWGYSYLRAAPPAPKIPALDMVAATKLGDDRRLGFNASGMALATVTAMGPVDTSGFSPELLQQIVDQGLDPENLTADDMMYLVDSTGNTDPSLPTTVAAPKGPLTQKDTKRDEVADIGYAIPLEITFTALNKDGIAYIYDIQQRLPMTEIYRIGMTSLSQFSPNNPYIQFDVTFIFVPKLFKTLDEVNVVLKELQGGTSATMTQTPVP